MRLVDFLLIGLGDNSDRLEPCLIPVLRAKSIIQIAAGFWHSMAGLCMFQCVYATTYASLIIYNVLTLCNCINLLAYSGAIPTHDEGRLVVHLGVRLSRPASTGEHSSVLGPRCGGVLPGSASARHCSVCRVTSLPCYYSRFGTVQLGE